MRYARTAALLTSVFSAGITLGYGAVPTQVTRALTARVGLTAPAAETVAAPATAGAPADPGATAQAGPSYGSESSALQVLRSPEFEMFGERTGEPHTGLTRPQTSRPSSVCGTGPERRLCNADDVDPGAAPAPEGNWMVGLRAPDLPVHASVRVERFFRYLTESTNGRKLFRNWLKRSGKYHEVVARALRERGLPQDLEALVFVESGYSPTAVSSEGAMGLWQFMPGTAHVYGLAVDEDFDERRSIEKATDAATRYLSDLYERFGSWELAMAAYDMGYGRLTQRVTELSTNDYWTLSLVRGAIPDEALAYVPKIIAVALLLRNLDRFGFDEVQQDPPQISGELEVPGGTPLRLVARAAGTSVDRLRLLNPELLTPFVPERGATGISLHVPSRGLARANTMLPRLLAHFHPGSAEDSVDDRFDWGTEELLPTTPRRSPRPSSMWNDPVTGPEPGRAPPLEMEAPETADRAAEEGTPAEAETAVIFYRVDDGETLPAIARRFGIKTARVVADNRLDPAAKLQKGMLLKLHVPRSALSRLASERPLDDSQYAPPVQLDGGANDDDTTIAAPVPANAAPELRSPRDDIDPFAPGHTFPGTHVKRPHAGRSSGRRSMADFPELFERKP
jgi:membrane-bound lytic murein transglycosylase D